MRNKLLLAGVLLFLAGAALCAQDGEASEQGIHVAVLQGDYDAVLRFLDEGVSPDGYNLSGFAPLHSAARAGYARIARLLLDRGANINIITQTALRTRDSALHIAARNGRADVVALLIERGISTLIRASTGNTALYDAEIRGDAGTIALITRTQRTQGGEGAREAATKYGIVRRFLDAGTSPNGYNSSGFTPLHTAARDGHVEIARLLLDRGANINIITLTALRTRESALHIAARNGHADVVALLIEQGINTLIRDSGGNTALYDAETQGDAETIALIAEAQEEQAAQEVVSKYDGAYPAEIANQPSELALNITLLEQRDLGIDLFIAGTVLFISGAVLPAIILVDNTLSNALQSIGVSSLEATGIANTLGAAVGPIIAATGLGMLIAGAVYWGNGNATFWRLAQGVSVGTQEHGADVLVAFEGTGLRLRY